MVCEERGIQKIYNVVLFAFSVMSQLRFVATKHRSEGKEFPR